MGSHPSSKRNSSQKCVTGSSTGTNHWSLAPSVGWSLVFARGCCSWAPWHRVIKEMWDRCWCCVPSPLLQGPNGPTSETQWGGAQVPSPSADIGRAWYFLLSRTFRWTWPLYPKGRCWAGDPLLFFQVSLHSKGQYPLPRLLSFKNACFLEL